MPLPPLPPPAPPVVNMPLDSDLAEAARAQIERSLNDQSETSVTPRVHAIEAVANLSAMQDAPQVIAALDAPEAIVRFAAAMTCGRMRLAQAHDKLLSLAEDPDFNVRIAVRFALHRLGDTHLSHDLERYARDPRKEIRANTALVLGYLQEPSAVRVLRPMRLDPEPLVREQAAAALWRLGNEQGLDDLIGLTVSRYPDDQMLALLALAQPGDRRVRQHVRDGLTADWLEVQLVAARAMGMLGSDEGYAIAAKAAGSSDARQRFMAATALGAIGRPDSQPILRRLLADDYESVRIAAAQAILELKAT
jgi:HEAT repeat protein